MASDNGFMQIVGPRLFCRTRTVVVTAVNRVNDEELGDV